LNALWDFSNPALSEQHFRAALATAQGDDALVLHTQMARTYSLRREFAKAREVLDALRPRLPLAGAEARVRFGLEWGRSWASARHPPEALTEAAKAQARTAWAEALEAAKVARLDALAIDVVHMFVFIDTAPQQQLDWNQQALALVLGSPQPAARLWEASVRNNLGMALHGLQRFDEALTEFRTATALRRARSQARETLIGQWMEAWTLRSLGRIDEALALQLQLERDWDARQEPDPYVYEELAALYQAKGDAANQAHYAAKRKALRP
jgi:tetratricopeptide (TPR) repeat protein